MGKWEMVRLGDVCEIVSGTTPKSNVEKYWNGTQNWVTPAELKEDTVEVIETDRKITELAIKESGLKPFPAGTVLLSSRAPIGKVAIAGTSMYCNQGFKNLVCSAHIVNKYLYWFLKGKTNYLNSLGRGATFKEISKAIVQSIELPLPPLDEQKRIAKNLDLASEIVKGYKEQLAELDKLVRSVFYEMFSTLIEDQATYKPLSEVAKFIDYRGKTPEKSDTGITLITAKNVKMNAFSLEPQEFIPQNTYEAVMTRGFPQVNDVLFTTEAPLGNVCRIPNIFGRFVVGQRLITMQPIGGVVTSEYLEFILSSKQFQNEMRKRSSGSTVKGIRSKELVQLFVSVPPFHLQTCFAEIVTEIESQKIQIKQALIQAENLFNSLMQEYFE